MTPKQEERIRNKIARIRKELAADKKRWGGFYDDSRGLRYLPPEQFIKLKDYKGGLRYLRWFNRTFPDDSGYPIFHFDWALILYKTGNLKEAEDRVFKIYFTSKTMIDIFLEKEILPKKIKGNPSRERESRAESLRYKKSDPEFAGFAEWLENFCNTRKFIEFAHELNEIDRKLETEPVGKTRSQLVNRRYSLTDRE